MENKKWKIMLILILIILLHIFYFFFPNLLIRPYLYYVPSYINNFYINTEQLGLLLALILTCCYVLIYGHNSSEKYRTQISIFITILSSIGVIYFSYKLAMTNPDIAGYIYYGAYFEHFGFIEYIKNFSSPIIDSWVSAPLIGIINGIFLSITNGNFFIFHLLQFLIFFIFSISAYLLYRIIYGKGNILFIIPLFVTTPFLFSQFYMPLTDIPSALFTIYAIICILYGIKKDKSPYITLSSIFFILAFLTKYLMLMYIVATLIFCYTIYKDHRKSILKSALITAIGIGIWFLYKPAAFNILFIKVLFENTALNNSLLGNVHINSTLILTFSLFAFALIGYILYKNKGKLDIYKNFSFIRNILSSKYFKLIIGTFLIFSLFVNIGINNKIYFHRSYFVGIGILYILFLIYFIKFVNFKKAELLFLGLFIVSFYTPNLMFKYLIPIYPFIIIIGYHYLLSINYKLSYVILISNLFILFTFIIPQINQTYGSNFIKTMDYIERNNVNQRISIGFIGEDDRQKMIRSADFTLTPFFYIYNNNLKYSFITMGYDKNEGHRKGYAIEYKVPHLKQYNEFANIFETTNLLQATKEKDIIFMVINNDYQKIDIPSQKHKKEILEYLESRCYKTVFDSGTKDGGIWMNKTIILQYDTKCKIDL